MAVSSQPTHTIWIATALVVATLGVYWQSFTHGFVSFDDPDYVSNNPMVQRGVTVETIAWAFTSSDASNWHPATWVSLMIDTEWSRIASPLLARFMDREQRLYPGAYHFTNVMLHLVNVLLLFSTLRRLTGALWPCAFVSALLAVHPMHIESVAWITERKDVLSMFFMLLTIRAYQDYARDRDIFAYLKMTFFFALGLMSKPMLVTLPCVLLLLDFWPLRRWDAAGGGLTRKSANLVLEKLPLLAMACASSFVTAWIQVLHPQIFDGVRIPLIDRLQIVAVSYIKYLGALFWPTNLAVLYPNPAQLGYEFYTFAQIYGAAALLLAITVLAIWLGWQRRYLIMGWLWFLGTMTPVIGFVQIGRHSMADRYAYIPYVGLYIAIAWLIADVSKTWVHRRVMLCGAGFMAILLLGWTSFRHVKVWENSRTLFTHAVNVTEDNWVALSAVGMSWHDEAAALQQAGQSAEADAAGRKSLFYFEQAVRIAPDVVWLYDLLARTHDLLKQYADAQEAWEQAIRLTPERAKSHWELSLILMKRGERSRALHHAWRSVELEPNSSEAHFHAAIVLSEYDLLDDAVMHMQRSFELDPALARRWSDVLQRIKMARDAQRNP